jgi:hypothetical protein
MLVSFPSHLCEFWIVVRRGSLTLQVGSERPGSSLTPDPFVVLSGLLFPDLPSALSAETVRVSGDQADWVMHPGSDFCFCIIALVEELESFDDAAPSDEFYSVTHLGDIFVRSGKRLMRR